MWARVMRSCHGKVEWGTEGLELSSRRRGGSGWWAKIIRFRRGTYGKWLRDNIIHRLSNGSNTKFWHHTWSGSLPLKMQFPRLFQLSNRKDGVISDMGRWDNGVWCWNLTWRRNLYEWESESMYHLLNVANSVNLIAGEQDGWTWKATTEGQFSTKSAYASLAATRLETRDGQESYSKLSLVWKIRAPHKAKTTAWRLLGNRLPTCDNLIRRKIPLTDDATRCVVCDQQLEDANHFFLNCQKIASMWNSIQLWLGVLSVSPTEISSHYSSFTQLGNEISWGMRINTRCYFNQSGYASFRLCGNGETSANSGILSGTRRRSSWKSRLGRGVGVGSSIVVNRQVILKHGSQKVYLILCIELTDVELVPLVPK